MSKSTLPPHFAGFGRSASKFFEDLKANMNREWFLANKTIYDAQVREPLVHLVEQLSRDLEARGIPLTGTAKGSIFRINRDVRFSKNKDPYKTNAGLAMARSGDKNDPGVLYFHFDPEGSFAAAGFYMPDAPLLNAIRDRIVAEPEKFCDIVDALADDGLELSREDALKNLPRGYAVEDGTVGEWLKLKSFVVRKPLKKGDLTGDKLPGKLVEFAQSVLPLLEFGWSAK